MNKISFGIVGIFGILMPGALLLVNIFFPLSAMHNSLDWFKGNAAGYKMDTVIIIVLILLAFTAGTVLRTLPPRSAEWLYRRFSKWDFYSVLRAYLEKPKREHFSSIPDDVWDKHYNPEEVAEKRKHWRHMRLFNFSKNYVIANSERLAREVQTAEGLSRFMASVFWCSLVGVVISGYSFLNILDSDKSSDCLNIAIYFILANSLLFIGSARGVGTIREHEGEVVMQSFFCLHLSNKKDINNDEKV